MDELVKTGWIVSYLCGQAYPERLHEIFAPPRLWRRGTTKLEPSIAVVGTRHPTPYGSGVAEMLSRDLRRAAS
jgi:DNA processing protein